jgi:hypothetical protein
MRYISAIDDVDGSSNGSNISAITAMSKRGMWTVRE